MNENLYRSFTDSDGRSWRVSEFFATTLIRRLNIDSGDEVGHVPLLLTSGEERRWTSHGPSDWPDVSEAELVALLSESVPMPDSIPGLGGYSDG